MCIFSSLPLREPRGCFPHNTPVLLCPTLYSAQAGLSYVAHLWAATWVAWDPTWALSPRSWAHASVVPFLRAPCKGELLESPPVVAAPLRTQESPGQKSPVQRRALGAQGKTGACLCDFLRHPGTGGPLGHWDWCRVMSPTGSVFGAPGMR